MYGSKLLGFAALAGAFMTLATADAAPLQKIDVTVKSLCTEKGTHFNILNNGPKWPQKAKLKIFFADDKSEITVRKVKLGQGHSVSFRIRTKVAAGRPLAVYVDPEWYQRQFKFDATQKCT